MCLCVFIVLGNVYIGNNKLYTEIHTLEAVETIHVREYEEDSENFKGIGIAENCTTLDEVRNVIANEKKKRIYNYFVEPIVSSCIELIAVIVCLECGMKVFLKDENEVNEEYAKIDALVFKNYFMKRLFIKKRYVGEEFNLKMINYNETLKSILGDSLEVIPRYKEEEQIVSASVVRKLLKENKIDEALKYIPRENHFILRTIVKDKYGN